MAGARLVTRPTPSAYVEACGGVAEPPLRTARQILMPTMPTRIHRLALKAAAVSVAGGLVLGLGACGQGTRAGTPSGAGSASSTGSASGTRSPSGGATPSPSATTPSPTGKAPSPTVSSSALPQHEEVSALGQVVEGLRPQCVVLQTSNRRYVLTGSEAGGLRVGQRVAVVGVPRPDLVSPCGAILVVSHMALR
jgi:hypothetical protein